MQAGLYLSTVCFRSAAAARIYRIDLEALRPHLKKEGLTSKQIKEAFEKFHERNSELLKEFGIKY